MGRRVSFFLISIIFIITKTNGFLWDSYNIDRLFAGSNEIFERLKPIAGNPTDKQCLAQFQYFVDELKREQDWTFKILDSWGKMPSGIASGNYLDLGHFDQCFESKFFTSTSKTDSTEAHYCQMTVRDASVKRNTSFSMALCVPSACSPAFTEAIMSNFIRNVDYKLDTSEFPTICPGGKPESFGPIQWVAISLCIVFGVLLVSSTAYELHARSQDMEPNKLYTSFSLVTNLNRLLHIQQNRRGGQFFDCLDGIRVLAIGWVVLLHCFEYPWFMPATYNRSYPLEFKKTWGYPFMRHGDVAVETFFVVTGFLIAYNFMKAREKSTKFNVVQYYVHRFFRIAPAYYVAVLFVIAFIQYMGDGPSYSAVAETWLRDNCVQYWWSALIFIQNWVPSSIRVCISSTWYISADMQFFLVSPIFLFMLVKWGKKCYYIFGVIIIGTCTYIFVLIHVYQFNWENHLGDKFWDYDPLIFHQSQNRIGPWMIGLLLGYYMFTIKDKRLNMKKSTVVTLWTLSVVGMIVVIWSPWPFYIMESDEIIYFSIHQALHRNLWALTQAWVIFACVKGYGGVVNWLLSLPLWQPLSKLTYCIYIIHNPFIMMTKPMQRTPDYHSIYQIFHYFLSIYLLSILVAIPWTLTFEMPFIQAETELWKLSKKKENVKENGEK